jgi:hypothetical protein
VSGRSHQPRKVEAVIGELHRLLLCCFSEYTAPTRSGKKEIVTVPPATVLPPASMVFMIVTRTIHPPAGANPLIMVHHHAGIFSILQPVGVGVFTLFPVAILWSRIRPGKKYPNKWW